jgi:flavin-dependent dehydrogenase
MASRPIEIIGGGLAGLTLGLALRRHGVAVTVHEAGGYPRHRVCGEFINGLGVATITCLGLESMFAGAQRHDTMAWYQGERLVRIQELSSPAYGLSRHALDARLAGAFMAAGGTLCTPSRIADPEPCAGRVLATGRRRGAARWLGLKLHAHGLALPGGPEMHLGTGAYVGLVTVETGAVNLCGLFRVRSIRETGPALLAAYLRAAGLGRLALRLALADPDAASFCAVAALSFGGRTGTADGNGMRIGDARQFLPPITGNGMASAIEGAGLAVAPLLAYARGAAEWPATCRAVDTALRRRFRVRCAVAAALHPLLLLPGGQRTLAVLARARLLPLRLLQAMLNG